MFGKLEYASFFTSTTVAWLLLNYLFSNQFVFDYEKLKDIEFSVWYRQRTEVKFVVIPCGMSVNGILAGLSIVIGLLFTLCVMIKATINHYNQEFINLKRSTKGLQAFILWTDDKLIKIIQLTNKIRRILQRNKVEVIDSTNNNCIDSKTKSVFWDKRIELEPSNMLYRRSNLAHLRAKKRMKADDDPTFLEGTRRILDFMYKAWQDQKCCDVVIKANGGVMHAHSVAFGAYSDTLTNSFYGYSNGEVINLDLSDFRGEVILTILHFLYTTELELNCHIIEQVLSCATKLGLDIIVHMCMDYLTKVDIDNAVLHYSIAENNTLKEIRDNIIKFLLEQFSAVSKTKHFVYMPFERLIAILRDENLCVDDEVDVFRAIVAWVDHDRPNRIHHNIELLQCVRFPLMSAEVLNEVEAAEWIFTNPDVWCDCLYKAMKFNALHSTGSGVARGMQPSARKSSPHRMSGDGRSGLQQGHASSVNVCPSKGSFGSSRVSSQQAVPQNRLSAPQLVPSSVSSKLVPSQSASEAVTAGSLAYCHASTRNLDVTVQVNSTNSTKTLSGQISSEDSTKQRPNSASQQLSAGESVFHEKNFGSQFMTTFKEALLMSARQKELKQTPPAAMSLTLVAIGGIDLHSLDPQVSGKSMYCYAANQNSWSVYGCKMTSNLHHHGVAVVNQKLYVIGGSVYKGSQNLGVSTDEVMVFDPLTSEWKKAASMTVPRAYLATAVWRNRIYAVGGENHNKQKLDSIECFDVELNQWRALTHLPGGARVGPAAAVHQDGLFVVGGYNRSTHKRGVLENVAFYDLLYKRWIVLSPLVVPRCHASLVVIEDRLFLIGGRTRLRDSKNMTSVDAIEEYNLDLDKWTQKTTMKYGRHDMGCTAIGTKLYIVGGIKSPNPACVSSVECYNVATNEWVENAASFPHSIAGVACAPLLVTEQEPLVSDSQSTSSKSIIGASL